MKKLILLAAVAMCATAATAQIASGRSTSFFSTERSEEGIKFGIRAGINLNKFTGDAESDAQTGFRLGVAADIPIIESLHFEPSLNFVTRPSKRTGVDVDYDSYSGEYDYCAWTRKYPFSYLEIPLLISYRYNFSEDWGWRVNLGPYIAYGLGGKYKYSDTDGETESQKLFGEEKNSYGDKWTNFKRLDVGLMFGTGVTYRNFLLEVGYQIGFTNINKDRFWKGYYEDKRASVKNDGVYVQLGYNF